MFHLGIKGVVTDTNGQPIEGAEVKVKGRAHPIHTTSDGEYWRLLMPHKTYTVQVGINRRYNPFNYRIKSKPKQPRPDQNHLQGMQIHDDPKIDHCRISGLQAQH